ncbi:MAG: hypothetical protein D6711_10635 [Chloroflexi bacterium]|nr:MAG: hypothetical protein D6711_10635 [Chloroflexota bacterium]
MKIIKIHSHKQGHELILEHHPECFADIIQAVESFDPLTCLIKISEEKSKIRRWGGLIFSPRAINRYFRHALYPLGWAEWDEKDKKYKEPRIRFDDDTTVRGNDRFRSLDGLKDRVGLEIQMGKYAFMGYDVFSKMIIFSNKGMIDYGIELVLVQEMVNCMSTGVSAFEHLMIDFRYRGEADIDIPVAVLGFGATEAEWNLIRQRQEAFRHDPEGIMRQFPEIGGHDLKGTKPGPK